MKNIGLYVLLSVLFFSCKTDPEATERMDLAETLLTSDLDSAYAILAKIDLPDKLNERQFARWCMLYCQAADKTYHDMAYTEQLDRALAWYKRHGSAEQQAWIGLYLGRSYVEDKLFVPATKAYSDALELAKKKHLYNVAGYICSYTADLYTYTRQRSEERRKFEEAAEFFKLAENERSYAFALRDVSRTWVFDDSLSLALDLMLRADSIVTVMNDSVGMASIANGMGNIYKSMGKMKEAKSSYQRSFSYDTTDLESNYLALSNLYYNNDILDSARYYLEKINYSTDNLYIPSDRLYMGYLIEKEANNIPKAFQYLEQCYEAKNSLYDSRMQVDIIDAEKRHNLYSAIRENQELRIFLYKSIIAFILFCLLAGSFFQYKNRKRLTKLYQQQLLLDKKEWQLSDLKEKIKEKEKISLNNNEEIKHLKEQEWEARKEIVSLKCDKLRHSLLSQELKLRGQAGKPGTEQKLIKQDWIHIRKLVDDACPDWIAAIENTVGTLTPADIETCYLSFFDLSLKAEALLLGLTVDSANKRRLRTRQKLCIVNKELNICIFIIDQTLKNMKK
ncbi:MAG: hypothetical protein J6K31_14055 [Parabacteroides sp.]|nr:hypothetical protein [Parabacteroides sp.]